MRVSYVAEVVGSLLEERDCVIRSIRRGVLSRIGQLLVSIWLCGQGEHSLCSFELQKSL